MDFPTMPFCSSHSSFFWREDGGREASAIPDVLIVSNSYFTWYYSPQPVSQDCEVYFTGSIEIISRHVSQVMTIFLCTTCLCMKDFTFISTISDNKIPFSHLFSIFLSISVSLSLSLSTSISTFLCTFLVVLKYPHIFSILKKKFHTLDLFAGIFTL